MRERARQHAKGAKSNKRTNERSNEAGEHERAHANQRTSERVIQLPPSLNNHHTNKSVHTLNTENIVTNTNRCHTKCTVINALPNIQCSYDEEEMNEIKKTQENIMFMENTTAER